ncbi:MAG: hypothetical protein ABSG21_15755 [Spirochaetia bacterium]
MKKSFPASAAWLVALLLGGCPSPQSSTPVEIKPSLDVTISRSSVAFTDESLLNLGAAATGSSGSVTWSWYVNGALSSSALNSSIVSLANALPAGSYSIDVVASDGTLTGSANFTFQWQGQLSNPPSNAQANWAYYDTKDCVPYFYSDPQTRQPFSSIPVHVASLASSSKFPSGGLGYDYPMDPPESATDSALTGYGSSSFYSDTTGITSGNPVDGPRQYTALRVVPEALMGVQSLALNDIKSVSFWTKQASPATRTWQLRMYTINPNYNGTSDKGWYQTRINSAITTSSSDSWILNSTSPTTNPANLLLFDKITPYGRPDQKPQPGIGLGGVKNGDSANGVTISPHGSEAILWIDIAAGDGTDTHPVKSYLDGVTITTTSGKALILDLGD